MLNTKSKMKKVSYSLLVLMCLLFSGNVYAQSELSFDNELYQKALWMTTRFYGAQRMGEGVNWLVATHEADNVSNQIGFDRSKFVKGKSFLKDKDGDYDLTGGWFDCGDFVLFGQTFFYSAYMLLLGYTAFPEGYPDYYSEDYHGYINADDYTWEGKKGEPDGIPDILNEVKYATDYIIKAVRDNRRFYYQKGNGNLDHKVWCTSTVKSALPKNNGGEADGTREISCATGNATAMASQASAALAIMARVYAKYDQEYADKCLEKAKVACEFVEQTSKGTTKAPNFYEVGNRYIHDMVSMYAELYKTTQDPEYLRKAGENCGWLDIKKEYNYGYTLCYDHREDLAVYEMASLSDESEWGEKALNVMSFYVDSMYKPVNGYVLNKQGSTWGALRYPANQAFVFALYDKLTHAEGYNPYTIGSVEYIMGKNDKNLSFIVGLNDNCTKKPHHRNYYHDDTDTKTTIYENWRQKDIYTLPDINSDYKFFQIGYMVGGSLDVDTYLKFEDANEYSYTEGGIDYQAGLVGALAYINAKANPVEVDRTKAENIAKAEKCLFSPNPVQDKLHVQLSGEAQGKVTVEVFNAMGELQTQTNACGSEFEIDMNNLNSGAYVVRVISGDNVHTERIIKK